MKTVGQILKESREKRHIEIDQVAQETKIRSQYLKALEEDNYQFFPSETTTKGFLRNYAQFLGINPEEILSVFKRDYHGTKEQKVIVQSETGLDNKFQWDPRKTLILVVILFTFSLLTYLGYQYHSLFGKPGLDIYTPSDSQETTEEQLILKGKTNPDNTVSVNGNLIQLNEQGEFSYRLRLTSGENKIIIEATNRLGRKTRETRTVYFSSKQD